MNQRQERCCRQHGDHVATLGAQYIRDFHDLPSLVRSPPSRQVSIALRIDRNPAQCLRRRRRETGPHARRPRATSIVRTVTYSTGESGIATSMGVLLRYGGRNHGDRGGDRRQRRYRRHYVDASGHSVTSGADFVDGDAGDDVIYGLGGNDTLLGSFGDDVFVGGPGPMPCTAAWGTTGRATSMPPQASAPTSPRAPAASDHAEGDTFFQIENLYGSDHDDVFIGDSSANMLLGGFGDDIIEGRGGADQLFGGGGVDLVDYSSSPAGVTVSLVNPFGSGGDAAGDVISGFESIFGSLFADVLTGDDGDNVISALTGDDVLQGLAGSDALFGGGGNDTLDGGSGADIMFGDDGDDTYLVDNAGDVVDETGLSDLDTVLTAISFSLADATHAMGPIENLKLIGTTAINGTGNALANVITGNAGSNVLDGQGGADVMRGGAGNDTYIVDNAGDVVEETGGSGTDLVRVVGQLQPRRYSPLEGSIENLTLLGNAIPQRYRQRTRQRPHRQCRREHPRRSRR